MDFTKKQDFLKAVSFIIIIIINHLLLAFFKEKGYQRKLEILGYQIKENFF